MRAATDVTLTIAPAACRRITGTAWRQVANTEVMLRSITRAKCSSLMSAICTRPCRSPALLTSTSSLPCAATTPSTSAAGAPGAVRSAPTVDAAPPASWIAPATFSAPSRLCP
ncbi:hypothetical protein BJF78_18080 [Pseudonocardia sp. CNS-139]|nr:hypothetical protein BJF78_18080 [Pseudonocardia sp. CNS-139]